MYFKNVKNISFSNIYKSLNKIWFCFQTLVTMFLHMFYSLDWFHFYAHVLMIYYECYYLNKANNFKINLNYHFQTWKTKHRPVHLLWFMLVWHTFYCFCNVFSFFFHFSMLICCFCFSFFVFCLCFLSWL